MKGKDVFGFGGGFQTTNEACSDSSGCIRAPAGVWSRRNRGYVDLEFGDQGCIRCGVSRAIEEVCRP